MTTTKILAKRKKSGGARKGAGAKPKPFLDKTEQVNFRLTNREIQELGGKENIRTMLKSFLQSQKQTNSLKRLRGN